MANFIIATAEWFIKPIRAHTVDLAPPPRASSGADAPPGGLADTAVVPCMGPSPTNPMSISLRWT
jgi:hypothetical protein